MLLLPNIVYEMRDAGIDVATLTICEDGIVIDKEGKHIQERPDIAAIIAAHDPTEIEETEIHYDLPVVAPDFIVQSPKPKANHLDAHAEAITESKKADKSIALIVLDMVVYIEELEKRFKKMPPEEK